MRQFWNDVSSVRDRVHVLGELPRNDALGVVARAKLVVLPSRWENFANTALEALALERPVIATRTGGFVEFIEHDRNGWLVPPGDAEALAAELDRRLLDSNALLRIGKAAGAHAAEFDAPIIATRLVALYEELLAGQPQALRPEHLPARLPPVLPPGDAERSFSPTLRRQTHGCSEEARFGSADADPRCRWRLWAVRGTACRATRGCPV